MSGEIELVGTIEGIETCRIVFDHNFADVSVELLHSVPSSTTLTTN